MSSPSTLQFRREATVIVGDSAAGAGLAVTEGLRVKFEVTKTIGRQPNTALIQIYNLTQANEAKIKGEFDEVILNAGYVDASLLVFAGSIRHTSQYRDGNDHITEIDAGDGDSDLRNTIINTTLRAGTSTSQALDHIISKFAKTKKGHVVVSDTNRIRGKVISGLPGPLLDRIAAENNAHWSIQDGTLVMVPVTSTLPTEAIVLRSDTGLLGAPEVNDKGIKAKCLLNPRLAVNGKVQIDNNDLKLQIAKQKANVPGAKQKKTKKAAGQIARLDPDGVYKIYKLVHKGDTRGQDWTTEVWCVGLGKPIPTGQQAA